MPWMKGGRRTRTRAAARPSGKGRRSLLTVLTLLSLLTSCATSGLAFRQDDRLQLVELRDRDTITLPYQLDFTFDGELPAPATAFAVLVDWTPPAPGDALTELFDDDPACSGPLGCPDGYLERNRIHVVTDGPVMITDVPAGNGRGDFHEVTVVLVDDAGRRVGETSAFARFEVTNGR